MWTYHQSSGAMVDPTGRVLEVGYSGFDASKNNPGDEALVDQGPIPRGAWAMVGLEEETDTHGPFVIVLAPLASTNTYGRHDFRLHGDSKQHPGFASRGCIILSRWAREQLWASADRIINVVS